MLWAVIIVLAVAVDRLVKYIIIKNIDLTGHITVIDKFFYIVHSENKGAAWGILQNGRALFIPLTIIAVIILVYFLYKPDNKLLKLPDSTVLKLSLSLITGGALGNLIDRIFRGGSVTDFLDFYFGTYHFPTFNIADMSCVTGTILLAYFLLFIYKGNFNE